MNKNRVLINSEASYLNTGYAVYCNNLISRLIKKHPDWNIAEFASYCSPDDSRTNQVPWKIYGNIPAKDSPEFKNYNPDDSGQFGAFSFEKVCLDFKPSHVLSITDYWMSAYIDASPFRKYFKWIWMVTCDAKRQKSEWLDLYSSCDRVLTYNDWAGNELIKEGKGKIKWAGSTPCGPNDLFRPLDKAKIKSQLGFSKETKIIGMVSRNQRRKLFPKLFQGFRQFLDQTDKKNILLYCHTSYPDNGWDIPHWLKEYNLCNKVLFTYVCEKCNHVFPCFFSDAVTFCIRCGQPSATMANVNNGASDQVMCYIYNLFDLYIQYVNSEGFGIGQVEAAACGVPVAATNYSAMEDVIPKLGGFPIKVGELEPEIETGLFRAIPDNDSLVETLNHFFSLSENEVKQLNERTYNLCKKNYNWDDTVDLWSKCIEETSGPDLWNSPPNIHHPSKPAPENCSNREFARWLIADVLGEPNRLNSHMELRLTHELNHCASQGAMNGVYYNSQAHMFNKHKYVPFSRQDAYNHFLHLLERRNFWEQKRCNI